MKDRGFDIDLSRLNRPYTLDDVPMRALGNYTDVLHWPSSESPQSYRQRIVSALNDARLRLSSRLASQRHNDDKLSLQSINYNGTPGRGRFKDMGVGDYFRLSKKGSPRVFTTLDIETDDHGRPVTVSALKQVFNRATGQFETVDNFQRFYKARNRDLMQSSQVHGLTSSALNRLRGQQRASYGKLYDASEADALKQFLGDSIIVGHNIVDFDLPHLFKNPLNNQTIDTLTASRNRWSGRKNDLDSVFKRLYGTTMAEAGLPHHDSMSDVIATALIAQKMLGMSGTTGNALRYVVSHPGTHLAPIDRQVQSQVISGLYNEFKKVGAYINMKDYDGTELPISELMNSKSEFEMHYNKDAGRRELPDGMHMNVDTDYDLNADILTFASSMAEVSKDVKRAAQVSGEWAQHMEAAMSMRNFADMRQFRLKASTITDPNKRREFIHASGYGDNETENIMKGTDVLASLKKEREQRRFENWRMYQMSRRERRGIRNEDRERLMSTSTQDEFLDAADDIDLKMQRITKTFQAFANMPMYNFERLERAFTGQVGGIMSSARGVIPTPLYSPLSRLVSGGLNAMRSHYAPLKYGMRATSAIGNAAFTAGLGLTTSGVGTPVGIPMMAVGGGVHAISQIVGNIGEAKITRWGEDIQNNLNTIGLVTDLALMPIKLFGAAVKNAIKSLNMLKNAFGGAARLMTGGLGSLAQMGNPLTGLTAAGYGGYMGSLSADYAALLGRGTVNGIYNDFATQRMQLYTTGQLNNNRLVAASMLGVFSQVYGSSVNEEESLAGMLDKLRATTKTQDPLSRKRTYMLANQISPQIANILQTMDTLGIDTFDALKKPAGMWGYGESSLNGYRKRFQRAQWEYQYAGMQKDVTMQRIGSTLWNGSAGTFGLSGKLLYNGFNSVLSSVAGALESGNWDGAISDIKKLWETIKKGVDSTWTVVKKAFNIDTNLSFGDFLKKNLFDKLADSVEYLRDKILPRVYDIWDAIVDYSIDRLTNLFEFLRTIRIDVKELKRQVIDGKPGKKPWITSAASEYDISGAHDKGSYYVAGSLGAPGYYVHHNDDKVHKELLKSLIPEGLREGEGLAWEIVKGDEIATARNELLARLNSRNVASFNKKLKEITGWDMDATSAIGNPEKLDVLLQAIYKIVDLGYSPHALANLPEGKFFSNLDVHDSKFNQIMHNAYDGTKETREAWISSIATEVANAARDAGNTVPKMIIEFRDKNGEQQTVVINGDGSATTSRYNGHVGVGSVDGVIRFQQNQSTKNVGY